MYKIYKELNHIFQHACIMYFAYITYTYKAWHCKWQVLQVGFQCDYIKHLYKLNTILKILQFNHSNMNSFRQVNNTDHFPHWKKLYGVGMYQHQLIQLKVSVKISSLPFNSGFEIPKQLFHFKIAVKTCRYMTFIYSFTYFQCMCVVVEMIVTILNVKLLYKFCFYVTGR